MNSQKDESVLLAFARTEGDGRYKINIYGTPDGLRNLASELVKHAQADQTHLADYDTDHTHYHSNHRNAVLAPSSDEVVLGRLDLRNGKLASWAQNRIDNHSNIRESNPLRQVQLPFPELLSDLQARPGMFLRFTKSRGLMPGG